MVDADDGARARHERARVRRHKVTVRRARLGADDAPIDGEAALSLVTALTRVAWTMSGRTVQRCGRDRMPYVFVPNSLGGARP